MIINVTAIHDITQRLNQIYMEVSQSRSAVSRNSKEMVASRNISRTQSRRSMSNQPIRSEGERVSLINDHNGKLQSLQELAGKLDDIVRKEKQVRHSKPLKIENEQVKELQEEIKTKSKEISNNNKMISDLRRRIQNSDIDYITKHQNELKAYKKQLKAVAEEQKSLQKISETQCHIMKQKDQEVKHIQNRFEHETKQMVQENKQVQDAINKINKQIRKYHELKISKAEKLKDVERKINNYKEPDRVISAKDIELIEQKIRNQETELDKLEREKDGIQSKYQAAKGEGTHNVAQKQIQLKRRQNYLRLNLLSQKEVVRMLEQKREKTPIKDEPKSRVVNKHGRLPPKFIQKRSQEKLKVAESKLLTEESDFRSQGVGEQDINYEDDFD